MRWLCTLMIVSMLLPWMRAGSVAAGGDWQLATGHYKSAKMPLAINAPYPGLTTANAYYYAHPSLRYHLPVCIFAGAGPIFNCELTTAPSGMVVEAHPTKTREWVLRWDNPTTSGSPHSVTLRVYDQEHGRPSNSYVDVSWAITVSIANWMFIDGDTGNNANDGTIGSPKQTLAALASGSSATFVVLHETASSYPWVDSYNQYARRIMSYPGEQASIDFTAAQIENDGDVATNRLFAGLELIPKSSTGGSTAIMDWPSGATDIVIFDCVMPNPGGENEPGSNPALFFSGNNEPEWTDRISFITNDIQGTGASSIFLGYSTRHLLASGNTVSNNALHGWSAKDRNQYWCVRSNEGLTGNTVELVNFSDYDVTDSVEVCWNNYASSGTGLMFELGNADTEVGATNIWSYRNTWQVDHHEVNWDPAIVTVEDDVCEYTTAGADTHGWLWNGTADAGTYSGEECVGRGVNIVNASGILQGAYAAYVGTRGHVAE